MQRPYDDHVPTTPTRNPRTPQRNHDRTPHRTPHDRTPSRTPNRSYLDTPTRPAFKTPIRPPDFISLAQESGQRSIQTSNWPSDSFFAYNPEKEPIKAYLRIRPLAGHHTSAIELPYLQIVDDLEVSMTPPESSNAYRTRNRAPERYKFTKIFTESVAQQDFFNKTTLPLISDLLHGENALVFAYGVTNSGKTYSIMGTPQDPGLLPRTLDVIFNSTHNYLSDSKFKPVMHSLVQTYEDPREENRSVLDNAGLFESPYPGTSNPDVWSGRLLNENRDKTSVKLGDKFEYGIWVSFAEIYTEKIYDLLVPPDKQLKRRALSLKYEFRSGHKYIAGIKEVKVQSIEEAYVILREGQRNRAVFSTLMNQTSSRSHSVFTIRVVRVPIDEDNYVIEDPSYVTVSKMSIVDLAGSERHRNTFNSGQRLKEAGNINKSLMVLGQCMETLRFNQLKAAMGKRQAVVPFRHSKLTELFKSSFEGDGKAVMVVNVNPFDTGFDENSHVMKFAAVAKDVATWRRIHPKLDLKSVSGSVKRLRTEVQEHQSIGYPPREELDSVLDDEDDGEDDDDPFVDGLITQLEDLRDKWLDAETRCATMESSIRQQFAKEMQVELGKMEEIYISALKRENDINGAQIKERIEKSSSLAGLGPSDDGFLTDLHDRQESLTTEIAKLRVIVQDHDATKQSLLEKIAALEKEKRREQESTRRLLQDLEERDKQIQGLSKSSRATMDLMEEDNPFLEIPKVVELDRRTSNSSTIDNLTELTIRTPHPAKGDAFERFLDLRKRLRRCVFREEYSQTLDVMMKEVEQFEGVSFELVKETNMGKLLKLVAQKEFKDDVYSIQSRAKKLFKHFAQLSIPILAPPRQRVARNRESMVVLSVDAGKEEELISEMKVAMDILQDKNQKLKTKVKSMEEGQRKLKKAFEKTRSVHGGTDPVLLDKMISPPNQIEESLAKTRRVSCMFSPILEAPAMADSDDEGLLEYYMLEEQASGGKLEGGSGHEYTDDNDDDDENLFGLTGRHKRRFDIWVTMCCLLLTPLYDDDDDSAPPPYYAHSFTSKELSLPSKSDYRHSFVTPESNTIHGLCQKLRGMRAKYKDNRATRKANRREKRPQDGKTNPFE
ncbi:kinesin motor domain-containing protein [Phycomyces nitens]|nr:kinesin motor domain-containing protein [Phycomyces nitens]